MNCTACNSAKFSAGTDGLCMVCRFTAKKREEQEAAVQLRVSRGMPPDQKFDAPKRWKGWQKKRPKIR